MYSKAIEINPSETIYYSNRAKALRKHGRLKEVKISSTNFEIFIGKK